MPQLKQVIIVWLTKRRKRHLLRLSSNHTKKVPLKRNNFFNKKQIFLLAEAILSCLFYPRNRRIWMHERSFAWIDIVEQSYDDDLWYSNFRVTKTTFKFLLNAIRHDISHLNTDMRLAISAKRRLEITLHFLASTAEYRTIGNLFGVSKAFVCLCVREVCNAISKRLSNIIHFPQGNELVEVIRKYERKWDFPMCAGAIDGTHIPIRAPVEGHVEYVNRKGYHSMLMQAVVDSRYLYRDVVIGWPGSVHDSRVFSNYEIFKRGNNNILFTPEHTKEINGQSVPPVIVADPAYPLLPWILKGYPRNNNAHQRQQVFNHRLSRAQMTVENTFGRWKGRFIRFSKRVDMDVPSLVIVTHASCILHNVCEVQNNDFLDLWVENDAPEEVTEAIEENELYDAHIIRAIDYFCLQN